MIEIVKSAVSQSLIQTPSMGVNLNGSDWGSLACRGPNLLHHNAENEEELSDQDMEAQIDADDAEEGELSDGITDDLSSSRPASEFHSPPKLLT